MAANPTAGSRAETSPDASCSLAALLSATLRREKRGAADCGEADIGQGAGGADRGTLSAVRGGLGGVARAGGDGQRNGHGFGGDPDRDPAKGKQRRVRLGRFVGRGLQPVNLSAGRWRGMLVAGAAQSRLRAVMADIALALSPEEPCRQWT